MQMWNWEFRKSLGKHIYSKAEILEDAANYIISNLESQRYHVTSKEVDYYWNSVTITIISEDGFDGTLLKSEIQRGFQSFLNTYRDQIIAAIGEEAKSSLDCAFSSLEHAGLLFDLIGYPGSGKNEKVLKINL